jgi:hypothetical protein
MNICIITSRFYPQLVGSATMAYIISKKLAERGHSVTVITDTNLKNDLESHKHPFNLIYRWF